MTERESTYAEAIQTYRGCESEFKEINLRYNPGCLSVFMPWARIEIPKTIYQRLIALDGTLEGIGKTPEILREAEIAEESDSECFLDDIVTLQEKIVRYQLKCEIAPIS